MQVEDRAAVILGIDDGDDRGREPREVGRAADLGERAVLVEQRLERHRVGDLAALDELGDRGEDAAVHGLGEMLGPEKLGDAVEGGVVDEDCTQKRLLGLDVCRRRAVACVAVAQRRHLRKCCLHGRYVTILRQRASGRMRLGRAVKYGEPVG